MSLIESNIIAVEIIRFSTFYVAQPNKNVQIIVQKYTYDHKPHSQTTLN